MKPRSMSAAEFFRREREKREAREKEIAAMYEAMRKRNRELERKETPHADHREAQ